MNFGKYFLKDFTELPEKQGVYSWHVILDKIENTKKYNDLFRVKKFKIEAKGNFLERYDGVIKNNEELKDPFFNSNSKELSKVLMNLTMELSPPIYIGISKNIKSRLMRHRDQLDQVIERINWDDFLDDEQSSFDLDSEEESIFFGERIGQFIKDGSKISSGCLLVKVFYFDPPLQRKDLISVENLLNRTYFPLFGRN